MLKTAGTSRYVYNWGLCKWKEMWKAFEEGKSNQKPSAVLLSSIWTKEKPEWAHRTYRGSQTRALLNLGRAFQALWRGYSKFPAFRKKGKRRDSFYVDNAHAYINGDRLHLPLIGNVKMSESLRFEGKIYGYTVSVYAGQWHVSIEMCVPDTKRECLNPSSAVGIDVGIKHIAVASDGTVLDAPKRLKRLDIKLKKAECALSRSQRNSRNHQKLLIKKQKVQIRINNIRSDITHKFTSTITKNHGVVVVEDLDLKGMTEKAEHRPMRRSLNQSLMGTIIYQLSYKAHTLKKVDRFFPSSKLCSRCGHKKETLGLEERTYKCEHCGAVIDRDLNAAVNLSKSGMVNPGVPVELAGTR